MYRFFALLKAFCGKHVNGSVWTRLMAALPHADERIPRRPDHPTDGLGSGSGPPKVGVL